MLILSYLVLEWRLCLVEFGSTIPKLDAEFVRFGSNTTGRCVASGFAAATICHLRVLGLTQDEVETRSTLTASVSGRISGGGVPDLVGSYPTRVALVESAEMKGGNEVARFRVVFSDTY